jgi:hypothetical protein
MKKLILVFLVLLSSSVAYSQNQVPAIFYSNLTSGPSMGGQNNAGAFVTIHGKGFGQSRGSSIVTIGGGSAFSYQSWSDTSVTFQLGSAARTGNIVVTVAGVASNSVPFTVRSGNIYFVSSTGNNSNSGSYGAPWQSLAFAAKTIKPGDVVYVGNASAPNSGGTTYNSLSLSHSGMPSMPMALVAYPNTSVAVGSARLSSAGITITGSNWVLSGFTLRGAETAVSLASVSGIRITNSDLSCPNGSGPGACIAANGGSSITLMGNTIHDNGSATGADLADYHAVYLLGTNGVEIGWNTVSNTLGCNAINAQATTGTQHSFSIHDNYIYETRCVAVSLGTVDPSSGSVSIYNNVIENSGTGPVPSGSSQIYGYGAIAVGGGAAVPVQAYNNTIYNAGALGGASAGAVRAFGSISLTNNILDLVSGEQYVSLDTSLTEISGSNNLFNGAGSPLGVFSTSFTGDPQFVSATSHNYHLLAGSPAVDHGATLQLAADCDGILRPQGAGYDIGAYEYQAPGVAGAFLTASPLTLSFGTVLVGESASTTAILTNNGSANVTISQVNSTNGSFQTSGITFPITLTPGEAATLSVSFVPTAAGVNSGTLTVASNASNTPTNISVTGTGQAALPAVNLSPNSLTFASQTLSTTSAIQNITLTNSGTAALTLSSIAASGDFAQTNNCGTSLAASAVCTISVTFTPTATGTRTGAITFTDNAAASPQQLSLNGTGVAPAVTFSPSSLAFASQSVSTTSAAQTITLTNSGTAALTLSSIAASGDFAQTNNCGTSLAASAACTISVTFTPTATGTRTGAITFTDNAAASPQQVALTGTAVAASAQHSVALSWTETSSSVTGYNVYRSMQSGTGYTKLNSSLIPSQSYTDNSVSGGLTYYYVVTSVDGSGNESAYSAQVSAAIPNS